MADIRVSFFDDRNPLKKTREIAEENSAKFIKSYSFFDSTPAPYVTAYLTIPNTQEYSSVDFANKLDQKEGIKKDLIKQDNIIKISNVPYNNIKSFNYDTLEGKVEAEFIDAGGTLTNFLLKQFTNINDAVGTLTITFRFGWSTPTFPIRSTLIDDVANPSPTTYSSKKLNPKVRFSNYVSAIINDIELDFTASGIVYKINGLNNLVTRILPSMQYFTPYRFLGPMPLAEFGVLNEIDSLVSVLEKNKINFQK